MDVSPAHPQVSYPAKIDFGTILLGTPPATLTVQLENIGSANYTLSSLAIGSSVLHDSDELFADGGRYKQYNINSHR